MAQATQEEVSHTPARDDRDPVAVALALAARAEALGTGPGETPLRCDPGTPTFRLTVQDSPEHGPVAHLAGQTFPGEPLELAAGTALAVLRTDCGVFVVDPTRTLFSFGAAPDDAVAFAAADVALVHVRTSLFVVRADATITHVPLPAAPYDADPHSVRRLEIHADSLVINADQHRYTIPRRTIGTGPHDPLALAPRAGAAATDDEHLVRSVLSNFVALTHVRENRAFNHKLPTAEEAKTFKKGDRVYVVGPPETSGSLLRAEAKPAGFGEPATLHLDHAAGTFPPIRPVSSAHHAWPSAAQGLADIAAATEVTTPPLLARFAARFDADPWCRDDAWKVFRAFVPSLRAIDASFPIDPCVVVLCDEESGDYYGFYDYPPARGEGHGIVYYAHDENGLSWCAGSFDAFLTQRCLFGFEMDAEHEASALRLLRMLGVPRSTLRRPPGQTQPPAETPQWFLHAHPGHGYQRDAAHALREADALAARGDWLGAERAYVRALHDTLEPAVQRTVLSRLAKAYERLGWPLHESRVSAPS